MLKVFLSLNNVLIVKECLPSRSVPLNIFIIYLFVYHFFKNKTKLLLLGDTKAIKRGNILQKSCVLMFVMLLYEKSHFQVIESKIFFLHSKCFFKLE